MGEQELIEIGSIPESQIPLAAAANLQQISQT